MSTDIKQTIHNGHMALSAAASHGVIGAGPGLLHALEQAIPALEREHQRAERIMREGVGPAWDDYLENISLSAELVHEARAERDAAVQRAERAKAAIREALAILKTRDPQAGRREDDRLERFFRAKNVLSAALDTEKGDGDANQ